MLLLQLHGGSHSGESAMLCGAVISTNCNGNHNHNHNHNHIDNMWLLILTTTTMRLHAGAVAFLYIRRSSALQGSLLRQLSFQ